MLAVEKRTVNTPLLPNCLARFVSGVSRFSYVSPILKSLHWLPVNPFATEGSLFWGTVAI